MTMCNAPTGTFTGTILENDSDSFVPLFIFLLFHIPTKASSMYPYERRSLFPTGPSTGAATHLAREVLLLPWNEKEFFRFPPNIESAKNILCLPRSTWTEKEFWNIRSSEVKDKILFINGECKISYRYLYENPRNIGHYHLITYFNESRTFRRSSLRVARTTTDAMVVVRLPNTGYRGCKGVVKLLGPTAVGKVARRGAPKNGRASIAFFITAT
jgi:hypothetical protein